jgi:hypothetical protein
LTFTDCSGAGTFTYEVFAVKSADDGYAVLAASNATTIAIGAAPTKPPVVNTADLGALTVKDNGNGTYTFTWNAYKGSTKFNYYKLSGVTYPDAPGYAEGKGYWAVIDPCNHSVTVDGRAGTWNFNVEAIYYPDGKTTALARTTTLKVTMTEKVKPTAPPIVTLNATAVLQADGSVKITWDKYTGPYFSYYAIARTKDGGDPVLAIGSNPSFWYTSDQNTLTYTDRAVSPGHTYKYRVYAYSDQSLATVQGGGVVPACTVSTILAVSPVLTVTIPAAPTPTPQPPTPEPTPTPTPAE